MEFENEKRGGRTKIRATGLVWPAMIFVLALSVVLLTFDDYGVSWDESVYAEYGEMALAYFASGFSDRRCNTFLDLKYYGALFEMASSSIYLLAGEWKYEIRHLCVALTALFALAGVMKYGRGFSNPEIAVWAALSLMMLPRFYGHAFINSKDIPFAAFFVWAMAAMAVLFRPGGSAVVPAAFTGLAIGLALSVRVGGYLLFCFLGAGLLFCFLARRTAPECCPLVADRGLKDLILTVFWMVSIAWAVMVAFWPWAHEGPVSNPVAAMKMAMNFHVAYPVWYDGRMVMSDRLPWHYLPRYLLITTPPAILGFATLGMARCILVIRRRVPADDGVRSFLVLLWFLFPVFFVVATGPNIYDGIRHFLFVLPALAILSGVGVSWALSPLPVRTGGCARAAAAVLLLLPVGDLVALHPYQMTYFNAFAGGLEEAGKHYETDYWTTSYREAIQWINARSDPEKGPVCVVAAGNDYNRPCAEYYRAPHLSVRMVFPVHGQKALPPGIDYYVGTTRYGFHRNFPDDPVVHAVGRKGAVFTVIRKNSDASPAGRSPPAKALERKM